MAATVGWIVEVFRQLGSPERREVMYMIGRELMLANQGRPIWISHPQGADASKDVILTMCADGSLEFTHWEQAHSDIRKLATQLDSVIPSPAV